MESCASFAVGDGGHEWRKGGAEETAADAVDGKACWIRVFLSSFAQAPVLPRVQSLQSTHRRGTYARIVDGNLSVATRKPSPKRATPSQLRPEPPRSRNQTGGVVVRRMPCGV